MATTDDDRGTLSERAARQLANTTKTPPQWVGSTPRWLVQLLPWTPVEAGAYRVNRVLDDKFAVECSPDDDSDRPIARISYEEKPREYTLSTVSTTVEVHTRISDLFRSPMIGGGAILWYSQPLTSAGQNNVDLFYANLILDGHSGQLGLHVEPRFRGTKLRPFFDGPAWVEEAYAYDQIGPVKVKVGKVYQQLGLFWDDSFYGSVLVYDGLKLAPDYGVSAEGAYGEQARAGLHYFGQYFVVDGRTNVSLPGRDTISIAGAKRRNEVVARVEPFVKFGDDGIVKLGASGEYFQADLPSGTNDVVRAGADATVKVGGFGAWAEYLRQNGKHVDGFPIAPVPATDTMPGTPGQASGHNNYVLAGASYTYGKATARYNVSWGNYSDLKIDETLHEPALGYAVSPNLSVLAELVIWGRKAPTGTTTVDHSLDVTLHGSF